MNLHEYQAKALLREYGVPVPEGAVAADEREVAAACARLGGEEFVVKAQIHAGGRGKAGGVRRVRGVDAACAAARALLGTRLVTAQTGTAGQPVERVLIERPVNTARELYLACLVDRARARVALIASAQGGMDIEEVARRDEAAIVRAHVDPVAGLQAYQCRRLAFALGLGAVQGPFTQLATALYRLFVERDLSLVEINPLVLDARGALCALDAKIALDDNALHRQKTLAALRDTGQEDARESRAREADLNYVALDGDIGCMVNGAGLAMATMDLIQLHGGHPANFLDVGGGTTAERVAAAFKLILAEARVKAILVNIFGGIVRCDLIARGILDAVREVGLRLPVVVRLEGTNAEEGRRLLDESGLKVAAIADLNEAARAAVAHARG